MKPSGGTIIQVATFVAAFTVTAVALVVTLRTLLFQQYARGEQCTLAATATAAAAGHQAIGTERGIHDRLQEALQFQTITWAPKNYSRNETLRFHQFLRENFPHVHRSPLVHLEVVNEYSLLYTVHGSNRALKPYLLLAHLDVVPVQESLWEEDPFGGHIKDGYLYGRGALDLKMAVMGIMEALEFMLERRTPVVRSLYVAFGHDEEGRGLDGAAQIARLMRERGHDDVEYILDEGPYIFQDAIPGVARAVAMIGVAEKGLVNVRLRAEGRVGHSSLPPKQTAIVRMAKAVARLDADSHPSQFGRGPERDMVEALAPYASLPYRLLYANLWLFQPLVGQLLAGDPLMNSFLRTTTAVTMFHSGIKDNVLPGQAEAVVNHRIYPLSSVEEVLARDRHLIADPEIQVDVLGVAIEPHPVSPYGRDSFGYQTIRASIQQVFPETAIIPGMMYAATDTRWYLNFTRNIYRFSPAYLSLDQFSIVHGHNERISLDNYLKVVNFYHHVILNSNDATVDMAFLDDRDEF